MASPSGSPAGITDEVSSKRPAQPVAGRGCVFPLDGDKRLRVPSEPPGTPGSPSASLGAAERDNPPPSRLLRRSRDIPGCIWYEQQPSAGGRGKVSHVAGAGVCC